MIPEWQTGIVRRIESVNAATKCFFIELPAINVFHFKPGQFVTLDLPIHESRTRRWRSYSIASAPDGRNIIELIIALRERGAATTYLFNELQEGDELTVCGPHGNFLLPPPAAKDLFMICTGTGIAPFCSMLRFLSQHPDRYKSIHLVFGCCISRDLLYENELRTLTQTLPDFHYHPTLSKEVWDGHSGYVHPIYEGLCSARQPAEFMLCGWSKMIDEAKLRIEAMGYDPKVIHLELYG